MLRHNRLNQLKKEKVTKDINFDNFSALRENKILMLANLSLKTYFFIEVIEPAFVKITITGKRKKVVNRIYWARLAH